MALILFLFFLLLSFSLERSSFPTNERHDSSTTEKVYANYVDLVLLNSTLQYNYNSSNSTLSFVFSATPPNPAGWISWGVNPSGTGMEGAQVIAAYKDNDKRMVARTFNLVSYNLIVAEKLLFEVWDVSAEETLGSFKIYAKLKLPVNTEMINQVWQVGPNVTEDGRLVGHAAEKENLHSKGTLRLSEGSSDSATWWKKGHAGASVIGWSILRPLGLIISRYGPTVELAEPYWFYTYLFCQSSATVVGNIGFISGVILGTWSERTIFYGHLIIGITMVILDVIQIVTVCQKRNEFHQSKFFWLIACLTTVITIINVHVGMGISNTAHDRRVAYDVWMTLLLGLPPVFELGKLVVGRIKNWTGYGPVEEPANSGMQPNN